MIQDILIEKYFIFIFVCLETTQRVFTGMVEDPGHVDITQDHLLGRRDNVMGWAP